MPLMLRIFSTYRKDGMAFVKYIFPFPFSAVALLLFYV